MSEITPIRDVPNFPLERELASRIWDVIAEYNERISLPAAIGILELIKHDLVKDKK